jgi:hypothetical protein
MIIIIIIIIIIAVQQLTISECVGKNTKNLCRLSYENCACSERMEIQYHVVLLMAAAEL